ncbi:MAG: site-specific integrase [Fibrobacter sp.]|nr:site-specific integrase [Fibrobacter sp.]
MRTGRKVTISQRSISGGRKTLFLSYTIGGMRRRDFLKIYLEPTNGDEAVRRNNIEKLMTAEILREKKEREITMAEAGIEIPTYPRICRFEDYANKILRKLTNPNTRKSYLTTIKRVLLFNKNVTVQEMNRDFFINYRDFLLLQGLKESTVAESMSKISSILNDAVIDGLIASKPVLKGVIPAAESAQKVILSIDEIKKLLSTPCENKAVKDAFLFCCFTGLRFSDCVRLNPGNIEGGMIVIRMQKTGDIVRVPLSDNARMFLPEPVGNKQFFNLPSNVDCNRIIQRWVESSGIRKHVTFHVSRHSFATLLLANGTEIFTVSKLMGHRSVDSTTVYARLLDEGRKKAVDSIPRI